MSKLIEGRAIKLAKVYQSVKFEGREHSYFTPTKFMSVRSHNTEIVIERTELGGIIVKSGEDVIEIGPANVAYIQYETSQPSEEQAVVAELKSKRAK
jgi:hypothetical protein